jgi:hypothetical protein
MRNLLTWALRKSANHTTAKQRITELEQRVFALNLRMRIENDPDKRAKLETELQAAQSILKRQQSGIRK